MTSISATVTIICKGSIVRLSGQTITPDPTQPAGKISFPFNCDPHIVQNAIALTVIPLNNAAPIYVNNVVVNLNVHGEGMHQITGRC